MKAPVTLSMKSRSAWRSWLSKNHDTKRAVWLVYAKKKSGLESVSYEEAVGEAICFGWIDGQVRAVDNNRFMQRFSLRTKKSRWSERNITRAKKMIDAGLMTDAGRAVFEEAMLKDRRVPSLAGYSIPDELEIALASNPVASKNFQNMSPSHRLMYAAWVSTARKSETRLVRAARSIEMLAANKRLTDVFGMQKKSHKQISFAT